MMDTNTRPRHSGESRISIAHGNGGALMRELIEEIFATHLGNNLLDTTQDAAPIPPLKHRQLVITTDGFTVYPLEFPGGDIGTLAVHGTVNDLAVAGADPSYLTLNVFIEEGFAIARLARLVASMAATAGECGVAIVAGDTKVVPQGKAGGLYFATTGLGSRPTDLVLSMNAIRPGDRVLVSGTVGDHGAAVLLAREEFGFHGTLMSDTGSVLPQARALRAIPGIRFMRDPTRGGLATVANEIVHTTGLSVRLRESDIPVSEPVSSVCELLGYDPYYLASEGRLIAVADASVAADALAAMQHFDPLAAEIGEVGDTEPVVVLETGFGGERVLEELMDDPLPRIC